MKVNPVNNVNFKKIVETFRREVTSTWDNDSSPEVTNTICDTFEYTEENTEKEGEK